jgi:hypothetical protein
MKLTNKFNLPDPIVNAVSNTGYTPGSSDITVTQLIQPPLLRSLTKKHWDDLEEDVSSRVWALFGTSVHHLLEMAYKGRTARVEERVYAEVLGWKLGGQFDALEGDVLSDYKVTSVYAREGKKEWVEQLNVLRWLLHQNGTVVNKLQIVAIFRDWREMESKKNADYPSQAMILPIKLWSLEDTGKFIEERVALHQSENPPICTDEERWATKHQFALMKKGAKRAIKLYESKDNVVLSKDQYWEERPSQYRRCESYCAVSKFCPHWKTEF